MSGGRVQVESLPDLDAAIGKANLGLDDSMVLGLRVARDVLTERKEDGANQDGDYV